MAPRADYALSHLVLPPSSFPPPSTSLPSNLTLLTTKHQSIIGLSHPPSAPSTTTTSTIHFEALLPRSLTRLTLRPTPSPRATPPGVLPSRVVGCASDGTLVSLALLEEGLWRRLCWLQRCVEWSALAGMGGRGRYAVLERERDGEEVEEAEGDSGGDGEDGRRVGRVVRGTVMQMERAVPIGFSHAAEGVVEGDDMDVDEDEDGGSAAAVLLRTNVEALGDMHIDGDVIARVLRRGGVEAVKEVLRELSKGDDAVGLWVRRRLERELGAVEEVVELVRRIEEWI